jgi:PPOX class probable F420-dependent enzyme
MTTSMTRDVEPGAVADLAIAPPRVAMAAVVDDEILLLPIRSSLEAPVDPAVSARIVHVPQGTPDLATRNVVVIADDGPQWFRLRSLTVRGKAAAAGDRSYRVLPERVVAWDYGSLRNAPAPTPPTRPRQPRLCGVEYRDDYRDDRPYRSPSLEAALSSSRVMILATRSGKGTPFAVPLWFIPHGGRLYAGTAASSWTVRNLAVCPRAALLLGGERGQDTGRMLVRGRARALSGPPPAAVLAAIAWRYYLHPRFAAVELAHARLWGRRMRYYAQARAAHVVITPESATECDAP